MARLARPRATHHPKRFMISRAGPSPSAAATVTCSPRTASASPPASATSRGASPAMAVSRPRAPRPLPDAKRSQHPCLPHGHRGPCGSTTMWPNSPAYRLEPSTSRPPEITAPPMPVPRVPRPGRRRRGGPRPDRARPSQPRWRRCRPRLSSPAERHPSASVTGVPDHPRQVGGETDRPGPVDQAGDPDPDGTRAARPGQPAGGRRHLGDDVGARPGGGMAMSGTTVPSGSSRTARSLVPPMSTPTTGAVHLRPGPETRAAAGASRRSIGPGRRPWPSRIRAPPGGAEPGTCRFGQAR